MLNILCMRASSPLLTLKCVHMRSHKRTRTHICTYAWLQASEHGKNLQLDNWRSLQLAKYTANPAHPWSRFATGAFIKEGNRVDKGRGPSCEGSTGMVVEEGWCCVVAHPLCALVCAQPLPPLPPTLTCSPHPRQPGHTEHGAQSKGP